MKKSEVLMSLLTQDRVIRFNIDMLEGLLGEIKGDMEEARVLVESCLEEGEKERISKRLSEFEKNFVSLLSEVLDYIYDLYEIFNFDITFLAAIPEELQREIERLDVVGSINARLEHLMNTLDQLLTEEDERIKAILTPFLVYREVIQQAMSFNRKFDLQNLQRIG
ncbi:hypothetical protein Thal_0095 [Thermocrinis albus DSM 14484]|uniref:Uncharacterized protein n=1 Tax=Thermocrinis albus (strain DSM 14484 / JCM 11386 / HI 11/12) TaxID=638303 RepID=D3SNJ5_THEAH|nr:hypothetical protein [Thermocrinis albus]ADC88732.1 hypothetical protein Thal_0095 [Thermocrinis albus DSM 14484]